MIAIVIPSVSLAIRLLQQVDLKTEVGEMVFSFTKILCSFHSNFILLLQPLKTCLLV